MVTRSVTRSVTQPVAIPFALAGRSMLRLPYRGASLALAFDSQKYAMGATEKRPAAFAFSDLITFTRASGGGRFNAQGQYEWLPANQPRIDYDPVTGECRGLLVEEQRTNLLTYSNDFGNAAWAKGVSSIVLGGVVTPEGTAATKLVEGTSNTVHGMTRDLAATTAGSYTFSIRVKAAERSNFRLRVSDFSSVIGYSFDLLTGTATLASEGGSPSWSGVSGKITALADGWHECSISGTTTQPGPRRLYLSIPSSLTLYQGDGTSGIYIWGAPLEAGSFPTSLIHTTDAQVTRAADIATVNELSPWFNAAAGTFVIEHDAVAGRPLLSSGETLLASSAGAGRTVLAYDATGSYVSQNGGEFIAGPPLTFGDSLRLMRSATQWANAHCKSLRYYPRRLTLAEASA